MKSRLLQLIVMVTKYSFYALAMLCIFTDVMVASEGLAQRSQSVKEVYIKMGFDRTSLNEVFKKIESETSYQFTINEKGINKSLKFTSSVQNRTVADLLTELSKHANLKFRQVNNNIAVSRMDKSDTSGMLEVQVLADVNISGKITDENNQGLPGASVVIKGTTEGTTTDLDGNYKLVIPEAGTMTISYVGYITQEVVIGSQSVVDVQMVLDASQLEEIVVTAFGIEREKKALGYSAQELGAKDLSGARDINVSSYLTAKVAGVQVSKSASGVGGSTNVVIRGNSSISGTNQPLYVVDGIPIINFSNDNSGSGLGGAGDYDYGDGIGDINPQDVESMNVLKGPAATALYGSRGANGVVIVTTKSGKGKKGIGVEINSNITFDNLNLFPNYQNQFGSGYDDNGVLSYWNEEVDGVQYPFPDNGNLDSWGGPLDGSLKIIDRFRFDDDDGPLRTMDYVAQPKDNVRDFFETGITQSNNVAITGVTDKGSMRLSIGNSSTSGIVPNHEIKKKSVSFRGSTKVNDKLSFEAKVNYIRTEGDQRPATGYDQQNPMWNFAIMSRFTPLDYVKEYYERTKSYNRPPGMNYNPWYIVNEIRNNDQKDRVLGFTSASLKFNDWLSLSARVGLDFYSQSRFESWRRGARSTDQRKGRMEESLRTNRELNADLMLTANKQLSEDFKMNVVLGISTWTRHTKFQGWDARDSKVDDVYHVSNYLDLRNSSSLSQSEMQSVFFTGQLAYKNYLFLDITGRNDWSSTLGVNNNSFFYPSASTSFVFTDVLDIDQEVFTFGKLRVSWAQVGASSSPYLTTSGYSFSQESYNGKAYASKSGVIPLWDLKNELTTSWEVGTDLRFFENKVSLDLTYYNGKTSNQILSLPISNTSGYNREVINAGEIQNSGFEATLGVTPISTENFRWNVNANFSANKSKVVELDGKIQTYRILNTNMNDIHAQVGEAYGNIIGFAYLRNDEGRKIVSASGEYQRESEVSVLGNINPDWIGGLNNTIFYKGFSLNFLLDFVQGGELSSHTKLWMTQKGTGAWTVEGRRPVATDANGDQLPYTGVLEGVVENPDGSYSENTLAVPGNKYWASRAWSGIGEEFVIDGSYISLREVIFGYAVPSTILKKTPFKSLNLSVIGRNLMYLQEHTTDLGVAPESSPNTSGGGSGIEALAVPSTRSIGFNIKLTF